MKLTLKDLRPIVAPVLGYCITDPRVPNIINRAVERLCDIGNWVGTVYRFRVQTTNGILVWPRSIQTIIAYALCGRPGQVRNKWYEFLEGGLGILSSAGNCGSSVCSGNSLIDRGDVVAFSNVIGDNKKLQVSCDQTEAGDGYIILRFYGLNGEVVRGEQEEGERLTFPPPNSFSTTNNFCAVDGLYEVVKTATKGLVRLWELDTIANTRRALAVYGPNETVPTYRSSLIPGMANQSQVSLVDIAAKLRFVPVQQDNDVLMLQQADAIRLGCQAIAKEEKDLLGEAREYWQEAIMVLNKQLESYEGAGVVQPMRMATPELFGAGFLGDLR